MSAEVIINPEINVDWETKCRQMQEEMTRLKETEERLMK